MSEFRFRSRPPLWFVAAAVLSVLAAAAVVHGFVHDTWRDDAILGALLMAAQPVNY